MLRVALTLLLGAAAVACAPGAEREEPPERLVLIVIDTLRRDRLSPYGAELSTPHIQALADRGQVFTHALAAFHQTSMSMGALFTGRTPSIESGDPKTPLFWNRHSWCGLARFAREDEAPACIPEGLSTLAERLRDAGYWTIGIASNELLYEPFGYSAGFEDWVEVGRSADLPVARQRRGDAPPGEWKLVRWRHVNEAARSAVKRRPQDRFFLYVHYMDVHDYHFEQRPYDEAVEAVDRGVGELMGALERDGLLDGSVVILTSDHGERLGESRSVPSGRRHLGNPSFQEVLRVPLVVAPPRAESPGRLIRGQDLYALILGIAGVEAEADPDLHPEELFVGEAHFRTYVRGRWKSMHHRSERRNHLFDLEKDPGEKWDVLAKHSDVFTAHRVRVNELTARLEAPEEFEPELSPDERRRLRALGYLE